MTVSRDPVVVAVCVVAIGFGLGACGPDKVPTAPTTFALTLSSPSRFVTGGGNIAITANATGPAAGQPAADGTVVTFTAERGRFDPITARTASGSATTRYFADERHGFVRLTGAFDQAPTATLVLEVIGVAFFKEDAAVAKYLGGGPVLIK